MFVNYAHRGASAYAPENTLRSFYLGIEMGANGIETDVRRTKDGVLVLFHDDTLDERMKCEGSISDHTYSELLEKFVYGYSYYGPGNVTEHDRIVTLEEFLIHFGHLDITFAIELKEVGIEEDVVNLLEKYTMREKTYVTSFNIQNIERIKQIAPSYKVGYLTKEITDEKIDLLLKIGAEQICPMAQNLTFDEVKRLKAMGFNVRAWGVHDTDIMKQAYEADVDGMTVNFPDLLCDYVHKSKKRRGKNFPYNVLFIGNSYTYYNELPEEMFYNIARSAGYENVYVRRITKGGEYIHGHLDPTHPTNMLIERELKRIPWDHVVLQDQSDNGATDPADYINSVFKMRYKVAGYCSAKVLLYSVWAKKLGHQNLEKFSFSVDEMAQKLADSSKYAASLAGCDVAYVGLAFKYIVDNHKDIDLYTPDLSHPSKAGSYLAALVIFSKMFDNDLSEVTYHPEEINETDSKILLSCAQKIYKQYQ